MKCKIPIVKILVLNNNNNKFNSKNNNSNNYNRYLNKNSIIKIKVNKMNIKNISLMINHKFQHLVLKNCNKK